MSSTTNTTTISTVGPPSRRNTELAMLAFAVIIPVFAYANAGLALSDELPSGLLNYGLGLGLMAAVGHIVVRRFAPYADPLLLPLATLLNGLGLVLIWRLDQSKRLAQTAHAQGHEYIASAPKQLMYSAIGIALFVAVLMLLKDHRRLQRYTYISMVGALVLLLLPLVPGLGMNVFGARIWISVAGFSIQPGEFAKIVIAVFFAGYLMVKRDALALASRRFMGLYLPRGRDLGPILVVWAMSILILVFETDLGTSLLFFGMFVVMLYVATERTSWIVFGLLMSAVGAAVVGSVEPHVKLRVNTWLHPFAVYDNPRPSWANTEQIAQAMMAFGSGGTVGTGLGQGNSDLIGFAANSDFILATVGEELGLGGTMAILLLYALIVERGVRTALAARDPFGKLLACGMSAAFAIQVFVVAGGVMGLIPLTGMTMPFMANGGSSVIANWALVAVLIRISDTARRPAPAPAPSPDAEMTQVVRP
ncbi:FtsW/RodA/SpoVE family cell cycle protein [Streptomyces sp. P1-3]|uniref:FtsW/RodA/SpoVE family cell cycle protein n=1 Tax=Streptomyces sp. P1-3 TaxID=3421658 RepID=UPI003D3693BE